jgi:hypothetical protein
MSSLVVGSYAGPVVTAGAGSEELVWVPGVGAGLLGCELAVGFVELRR